MARVCRASATSSVELLSYPVIAMPPHECSAKLLTQMVRFIHTSDWQLGMTRRYLSPEAQARFTDARVQAIRAIGHAARERGAAFVVVAGDVFESNMVDRQLVGRACGALREAAVPFYLLPGNHDPLVAGSVWLSGPLAANRPPNVTVLDGTPVEAVPGVVIHSAPWRSKKLTEDAIASAYPVNGDGRLHILVGHGQVESLAPDPERGDVIRLAPAEAVLAEGRLHYIALGDRHSATDVGESRRIRYSGAPEPTEYRETDPGFVLDVTLEPGSIMVEPVRVATWRFVEQMVSLAGAADITRLRGYLDGLPARERTILNLGFEGTVSLQVSAELDALIEDFRPLFAAIERRASDNHLVVAPDELDFSDLGLAGFAAEAVRELASLAAIPGADGKGARDAISLLYGLARSAT